MSDCLGTKLSENAGLDSKLLVDALDQITPQIASEWRVKLKNWITQQGKV
jgi:hypothetical protein